ncbi:hypothetical protein F1737_03240 [Methanoplanus sp. FWC-SCC4]|uniref:Zn-finger protein n=2 Tax=Methanochimaera problematica TaxID=2609417 RepID=A0AA97I3D6_9EURY|nr:hypothetical protein F1737_03240 [Methanoplanus sp. FWC-SCC4]
MYPEYFCPGCGDECEHEILKESGDLLVQCKCCSNIHHVPKEKEPEEIVVKAIVSVEDNSKKGIVELMEDEVVSLGDLLVGEVDGEPVGVEVTAIEIEDKRKKRAVSKDIDTLWTRVVDKVLVKVSYHDGRKTIPLYVESDGEEDFIIGDVYQTGKYRYKVTHIKLRDGAMMRKEGWKAYARKIKRVYGIKSR